MITAIAIENFKGIGERVSLELKPITLLFGPNSAGKSTVLHALHYAREIFERHNLDPDQTITGGKYIDLGGFSSFVHNHVKKNAIAIRIDADVGDQRLSAFVEGFSSVSTVLGVNVREIARKPKTVGVEVSIAWSELEQCPYVSRLSVYADGSLFSEITAAPNLRSVLISKLVVDHPLLVRRKELIRDPAERELVGEETILAAAFKECAEVMAPGDGERIELSDLNDALPRLDRPLLIEYAPFSPPDDDEGKEHLANQLNVAGEISEAISDLVVGTVVLIRDELARLCYLGPFRETPSRNHIPPRYPEPARWATGLAAWDRLFASDKVVQEVNNWLSGPDSLQIGYQLRLKEFKEIPLTSPLMVLLRSERAFDDLEDIRRLIDDYPTRSTLCLAEEDTDVEVLPHDVGIGVSQLIPVVVLALDTDAKIAAVEQPELHVHPAVQVRLGDLFIHQIASDPTRIFILETHSEHLMLRLLRRIRETTEEELPPGHPGLTPDKVTVFYVEEGEPRDAESDPPADLKPLLLTPLRIDATGEFRDRWPHGFFEERGEELFGK
jgi:hypothetical protein